MSKACPYCKLDPNPSEPRTLTIKSGHYRRKSDSRRIQKFKCLQCSKNFSSASQHPAVRQKKRHFNERLRKLMVSGVSLRRAAKLLHLSRTTIARKHVFLGEQALVKLKTLNLECPQASIVEFDDQETFEHTKCKPLSITLAVESKSRRILAFEVSQMGAKGLLTRIALKKYGKRADTRYQARKRLFQALRPLVAADAIFKSDQNPHYPPDVRRHFPRAKHQTFKGQRGSVVGQGELKKIRFDPLFSLNHTCAMTRANMNRLFRRTWCTTKSPKRLRLHFAIYAVYHNERLLKTPASEA